MSVILKARLVLILALPVIGLQCNAGANSTPPVNSAPAKAVVVKHSYEIVHAYPHDPGAFTQGLIFVDGKLYEGTGQEGRSSVREVDLQTGRVLKKVPNPERFFGEGITFLNGKIYQLTWQDQIGFIYNPATLEKIGEFEYTGEGWGITTDGRSLIISDGSNRLKFLDPDSFRVTRTIAVADGTTAVNQLNELEFVNGEIYANIWHDERIVTIDPQTGRVTGWIDLSNLLQSDAVQDREAVLNGIAYDQAGNRLFVTGKLWPQLFEIRLKRQ